jgi:hypothetical protein
VVTRDDLEPAQKIVQSCHAVAECPHHKINPDKEIRHIVVLSARNTGELLMTYVNLHKKHGVDVYLFYDSDLDEYTSLCTEPLAEDKRKYLRSLPLMRG